MSNRPISAGGPNKTPGEKSAGGPRDHRRSINAHRVGHAAETLLLAGSAAGGVVGREFLLDVVRNLLVARELKLELARTARERTQARGIVRDLGIRDGGLDGGLAGSDAGAGGHALDTAAAGGDVAHHGAGVAVGHGNLEVGHGLKQHGLGLVDGLLEANAGGSLEGHLVGVDGVIGALVDGDLHVDHGEAGQDAIAHGLLDALVDGGDEAARDVAAHDLVNKLVASARVGLHAQPAVSVLAGAAGLLLVATLGRGHAADGLAVRNLERHGVGRHAGTGLKAVKQHADLRLANGGDHGLAGVLVALHLEGGVGVRTLLEEGVELALGAAGVGLDGNAVERVGEAEGRGLDLARDGEGVARLGLKLGNHG